MTINDVYSEIATITQNLMSSGLSVREVWPERTGNKVTWKNQTDISIALKNIPYEEKYRIINKESNYNWKMLDGALFQLMYEFDKTGRILQSHRLAFLPSPIAERYDDNPEEYENTYYGNSEFHDLLEKYVVAFPVRFDYNIDIKLFKEIEHPYSHASFGEYKSCRIPVSCPLTPGTFTSFILNNFYNYAIKKEKITLPLSISKYDSCIVNSEQKILHLHVL